MADDAFEDFATEVNTLNNLLRKRAARALRSDSVGPAELKVLQILNDQGSKTVPEIGRLRLTSRQNIQITVNRLRKAGMVELTTNPSHKRSELVRLTSHGQQVLDHALENGKLQAAGLGPDITEAELLAAMEFLQKVRKAVLSDPFSGRSNSASEMAQGAPKTGGKLPSGSKSPVVFEAPSPTQPAAAMDNTVVQPPATAAEEEIPVSLL